MPNPSLSDKVGVVVFARVITTLIDLAIGVAVVRLLSKTDVAVMSFILVTYHTVRLMATLGFPESVFYFFERVAHGARRALAYQTIGILGATAALGALVMWGISAAAPAILSSWEAYELGAVQSLLPIVALVALLEIPTWPFDNLMLAADRQRDAAWYQMLTSLMMFAGLIGPMLLGYPLETAIYGLLGYAVLRFVLSMVWINRVLPAQTDSLPAGLLKEQIAFAIPLGASSLVGRLNKQVDKFVVSTLLPATALAHYSVGAQEIPIVTVVPYAVGAVLISQFVRMEQASQQAELLRLWYKGVEKVTLLVVPTAVFFIATAPDFIRVVFGPGYEAAVLPFQIYGLIVLHRVAQYGSILQAFGDTRSILRITGILLLTNIVLSIPFTMAFGIIGTALSTFVSNMVSWGLALYAIGKHLGVKTSKVLPWPFYLRVLGLSAAIGLGIWGLRHGVVPEHGAALGLAWTTLLYLTLFAGLGTTLRLITRADWQTVLGFMKGRMLR